MKDKTYIKNTILKVLIEDEYKDTTITEEIGNKIDSFSSTMMEQITNYSKKLNKKENSYHFSPKVLKAALWHYLSNKKGYDEFQKSSLMIYPSKHTLKKLSAKMRVKEGDNVPTYGNFLDEFVAKEVKNNRQVIGWLLFDEMILKEGIYTNIHNGEIVGFASDRKDMSDLQELFSEVISRKSNNKERNENEKTVIKEKDEDKTVSYVNLWKFHTSYNKTHILEFYYNNRSLDKSNLLGQLFHILSCLNLIGVQTKAIISDAGGSNVGLLNFLRQKKLLMSDNGLIEDDMTCFSDPTSCQLCLIALCLCMTHGLIKALRNILFMSRLNSSRNFVSVDGVSFSWKAITDTYRRDIE